MYSHWLCSFDICPIVGASFLGVVSSYPAVSWLDDSLEIGG